MDRPGRHGGVSCEHFDRGGAPGDGGVQEAGA